jgi:hypothetical protein
VQASIRKLLSAPNALDDVHKITEQILSVTCESDLYDSQKIDKLLAATVDPVVVWKEILQNKNFFSAPTKFEGGYTIQPLIKNDWDESDFKISGITTFSKAVRDIRNALSHGKDQRTSGVITPTSNNFQKLRPWVNILSAAAAEVMVYKNRS